MNRNLRWMGICVAVRMVGNAMYFPFLALFLRNVLSIGYVEIGAIITAVGVLQLPFSMVGGLLTDRYGRRRLILIGLYAEIAATFGLAYAFSIPSLLGAIAAAAFGGVITSTTAAATSAYIADFAEGSERTRGFTFYRIGFNAGYSAGVTIGGLLISWIGFAPSVAVAGLVMVVGAAMLQVVLDPSPKDRELSTARSGREARVEGATDLPRPARSFRESLATLARDRPALEILLAIGLAGVVVGQWAVTYPLYVHDVVGIPYSLLGIGLALNGLVVVFGQQPTTNRVLGMRHTTIAIYGLLLYAVSFLALGLAGLFGVLVTVAFFGGVVVLTIGENLITIPAATLPSNMAPKDEVGSYNGAFNAMGGLGFLVAVFVGGVVLSATSNPLLIWIYLLVPAVPAILLFRHAGLRLPPAVDRA